jgi:hypothetical protein
MLTMANRSMTAPNARSPNASTISPRKSFSPPWLPSRSSVSEKRIGRPVEVTVRLML